MEELNKQKVDFANTGIGNGVQTFADIFKKNFSGQFGTRVISFLINIYLIRVIDPSILGLMNVNMSLLYNSILFLSREPFRKFCLSSDISMRDCLRFASLCPFLALILCLVCSLIWRLGGVSQIELPISYGQIILYFALSAFIEALTEPVIILCLKIGDNSHFARVSAILIFVQKCSIIFFIWFGFDSIASFSLAQITGSFIFSVLNVLTFVLSYRTVLEENLSSDWFSFDLQSFALLSSLLFHSVLKQILTDGSNYIMTFTNILSLKTQAVYDTIERLASLLTRLILSPTEQSASIFFSKNMPRLSKSEEHRISPVLVSTFVTLTKVVIILGLVVFTFSLPYSKLVVRIYGGALLADNEGAKFLSTYCFYFLLMAVNGIFECFAFSSMSTPQVFSHGAFLLLSSLLHVLLNMVFVSKFGAVGFICANCLNSALRIFYNWWHINTKILDTPDLKIPPFSFLPSLNLFLLLGFSLFNNLISFLIFGNSPGLIYMGAHLTIGGVMFIIVCCYIYQYEYKNLKMHLKDK